MPENCRECGSFMQADRVNGEPIWTCPNCDYSKLRTVVT